MLKKKAITWVSPLNHTDNTNNASHPDDRNATTSDSQMNCLKLRMRWSQHSQHRRTMVCRTLSNKSGMLAMSAEPTTICAVRSFNIVTDISYTSDFRWPKKKKIEGIEVRGAWRTSNKFPSFIPFLGECCMEYFTHEKGVGSPS
ncbi:hypothetical protein TNCV_2369201 [Trichonephila clavipes]|nr:hypothetical protein TNCV_2369201 [Trichonephila clavipes]